MKTLFTLLMPLMIAITFTISSHYFASEAYLLSAAFTLVCYSATSLWIMLLSSKKLVLR
jgi:hypothetical protein